jgi:hypothetical protein
MEARARRTSSLDPSSASNQRLLWADWLSGLLIACGILFLLAAVAYAGFSALHTWLIGQDRYLLSEGFAQVPMPEGASLDWSAVGAMESSAGHHAPQETVSSVARDDVPHHTVSSTTSDNAPTQAVSSAASANAPQETVPSTAALHPPIRVVVSAINVDRPVVGVPRLFEPGTAEWAAEVEGLFRPDQNDLVGHWTGSAQPGQVGNLVLVGHAHEYGYTGAFMQLGQLQTGYEVLVFDELGHEFAYRIVDVQRLRLLDPDPGQAERQGELLSPGGPERLTLVTATGASGASESERVYAIAERLR